MRKKIVLMFAVAAMAAIGAAVCAESPTINGYFKAGGIFLRTAPESQYALVAPDGSIFCVIVSQGRISAYEQERGSLAFSKFDFGLPVDDRNRYSIRGNGMASDNGEGYFIEKD